MSMMKEYISDNRYLVTEEFSQPAIIITSYRFVDTLYPTVEELISRLKDPEYLNHSQDRCITKEREYYLNDLSKRPDLTETQKRLIKLYQSKL
jgi:hypothetical protein